MGAADEAFMMQRARVRWNSSVEAPCLYQCLGGGGGGGGDVLIGAGAGGGGWVCPQADRTLALAMTQATTISRFMIGFSPKPVMSLPH
jgi:hypothetical protein